jgi:hypothetical protein
MKTIVKLLPAIILAVLIFSAGCEKKDPVIPCDGKGEICFTNKLDSAVLVLVVQTNFQMTIERDHMECLTLDGDQAYTFDFTATGFHSDTMIVISSCDKESYLIQKTPGK